MEPGKLVDKWINVTDADYPLPDPTWDYCDVYHTAWALQKTAQQLIATLSAQETSSAEADQAIRDHLKQIAAQSRDIMGLLD